MMSLPLVCTLPMLGSRAYLHGTTLFDAMLLHVPNGAELGFRIPHRIDTDRVRILEGTSTQNSRGLASLSWKGDAASGVVAAEPLTPSGVPMRVAYPEKLVSDASEITPDAVVLRASVGMSFVSTLIPMFKALLRSAPVAAVPGQWMFTRMDIRFPPPEFIPIVLRRDALIPGKLARAAIERGGQQIGHIYFSWVPVG